MNPWLKNSMAILGVPFEQPLWLRKEFARSDAYCVVNKEILIGFWDYSHSLRRFLNLKLHHQYGIKKIIYMQRNENPFWDSHDIPVMSGWIWATDWLNFIKMQPSIRERYLKTSHTVVGSSGKIWRERLPWIEAMKPLVQDLCYWNTRKRPDNDYWGRICTWRAAICLMGKKDKCSAGRNRREIEFPACGVPLILNYIPYAPYDPLIPNEHFYLCEKPENLDLAIKDVCAYGKELADNAYQWYERNGTKEGMVKLWKETLLPR